MSELPVSSTAAETPAPHPNGAVQLGEPMPLDDAGVPGLAAAWQGAAESMLNLVRAAGDSGWTVPSSCPGWSVGDLIAHLIGIELMLLGRPDDPMEVDQTSRPHVRSTFSRYTEIAVMHRLATPCGAVLGEFDAVIAERTAQLGVTPDDTSVEVLGPRGVMPLGTILRMRTFDTWMHLQDARRALQLPGDLATPAAWVTASLIAGSVPFMLGKNLRAPAGSTLLVTVTGPIAFVRGAKVGPDGRATRASNPAELAEPSVAIATDWATFVALAGGRVDPATVADLVHVEGAPELAERVRGALTMTP